MNAHLGDHDSQFFAFGTGHAEIRKYSLGWSDCTTSHAQIIGKPWEIRHRRHSPKTRQLSAKIGISEL
jgi:hypothetical protein